MRTLRILVLLAVLGTLVLAAIATACGAAPTPEIVEKEA